MVDDDLVYGPTGYEGARYTSGATYYAYDPLGSTTGDGNLTTYGDTSYAYNVDDQVSGVSYDGDGNPTSSSGISTSFDSLDRMTADGGTSITYRPDGMRAYQSDNATMAGFTICTTAIRPSRR